jgi:superfamily II DNA or RNA helicase
MSKLKAIITRWGNLIKVQPPFKELLAKKLSYNRREQTGGDSKSVTVTPTYLFREDEDGLVVPAGLLDRVLVTLRMCDVDVEYHDLRKPKLGEPHFENVDLLRDGQEEVIAQIIGKDMGIIWAPTGIGKSFIIRQIPKLWPEARILISCASKDIVKQTYAELLEMFSSAAVGFVGDGRNESDRRIVCCVDKSLLKVNPSKFDILIYDEVHRAAAKNTAEIIASIQVERIYGFSASPFGRSDRADLETHAMFGPVICKINYEEAEASGSVVPVDVWVSSAADLPQVSKSTTTALERWGLWRNEERNRRLREAIEWVFATFGEDMQTLVTVKTVEHAVCLNCALEGLGFALVYANMDGEMRERWEKMRMIPKGVHPITSDTREQMRKAFRSGELRRAIATGVWGTGVDFPRLNVLVRADGAGGTIPNTQLPGRVTRRSDGKTVGIVIDIDDRFNQTLSNRYERRSRDYRKRGWQVRYIKAPAAYLQG